MNFNILIIYGQIYIAICKKIDCFIKIRFFDRSPGTLGTGRPICFPHVCLLLFMGYLADI